MTYIAAIIIGALLGLAIGYALDALEQRFFPDPKFRGNK